MWWRYELINYLWPLIVQISWAAVIGPDTLSVNEDTFHMYGYEYPSKGKIDRGWAYSHLSPKKLEPLARLEWSIYHEVRHIYNKLNGTIPSGDKFAMNVKEYLEDFEATSLQLVTNQMKNESKNISIEYILTTNLLTPFLTVRRFRNYIRPWANNKTRNKTALQDWISRYVRSVYNLKDGPFRIDFHYSILSIIMPHFILDLKAQDIATGLIRGKKIDVKLKACHCLDIGVHGVVAGMFPIGIEWLELTIQKINNGDDSVDLEFARNWLAASILKHDERWEPELLGYSSAGFQFFEKPLKLMKTGEDRKWEKQKICEDKENLPNVLSKAQRLPFHLHWSLCKGEVEQSVSEKSQLFCWYEKEVNAMFQIGPLKVELLSAHPRLELVQFHDLISNESYFNAIKSALSLYPSTFEDKIPKPKYNYGAISSLTIPETFQKFALLAERVTGLKTKRGYESTSYATSYVPGGFACTHEDWAAFSESHNKVLVRVATFMLYIEQPQQGGETTFPVSLAKPTPFKGSAIFSYNLLRSGEKDKYAPHASCPMTFGRKWVVAKDWLYEDQAQFTCSKEREEKHEILINGKTKYRNKILQKF